jgi:predicted AlkP superfamily phosphohydrolase/phosphomutase
LDGGTFRIIDYLVAQGRLPNFATFMERGSRATLKSTVPAVTPAAWSAFYTGTNPGKTGVVDFFQWTPGEQKISLVNATNVKGRHIWSVASETGNRVCVYNVPVTYPATKVNGVFISGMDAPHLDDRAIHPLEFRDELLSEIPDFSINSNIDFKSIARNHEDPSGEFTRQLNEYLQMELRTIEYLLKREPWNLFVSVIRSTDTFQHRFMKSAEKMIYGRDPVTAEDKRRAGFVFSCYESIDGMLGRIRGPLEERNGNLILMSDHGFTSLDKTVSLNKVLEEAGLLTFLTREDKKSYSKSLKKRLLKKIPKESQKRLRGLVDRVRSESWVNRHTNQLMGHIDFEKTRAFVIGTIGCLYVNSRERQPQGIVNGESERQAVLKEVESAMHALIDPDDGKNVVVSTLRREQIYHGEQLENLPDMVIETQDTYLGIFDNFEMDQDSAILTQEDTNARKLSLMGTHDSDGILIMYGAGICKADIGIAQITEIAPTIFELMGIEDLKEFDGAKIADALIADKNNVPKKRPSADAGHDDKDGSEPDVYSEDDEEEIRKRLENLGYL